MTPMAAVETHDRAPTGTERRVARYLAYTAEDPHPSTAS